MRFRLECARVNAPNFREKYLKIFVPKIEKFGGGVGRWWIKWHEPRNIGGTICPFCSVKKYDSNKSDFLENGLPKTATTKMGELIESAADNFLIFLLKKFRGKIRETLK